MVVRRPSRAEAVPAIGRGEHGWAAGFGSALAVVRPERRTRDGRWSVPRGTLRLATDVRRLGRQCRRGVSGHGLGPARGTSLVRGRGGDIVPIPRPGNQTVFVATLPLYNHKWTLFLARPHRHNIRCHQALRRSRQAAMIAARAMPTTPTASRRRPIERGTWRIDHPRATAAPAADADSAVGMRPVETLAVSPGTCEAADETPAVPVVQRIAAAGPGQAFGSKPIPPDRPERLSYGAGGTC